MENITGVLQHAGYDHFNNWLQLEWLSGEAEAAKKNIHRKISLLVNVSYREGFMKRYSI